MPNGPWCHNPGRRERDVGPHGHAQYSLALTGLDAVFLAGVSSTRNESGDSCPRKVLKSGIHVLSLRVVRRAEQPGPGGCMRATLGS